MEAPAKADEELPGEYRTAEAWNAGPTFCSREAGRDRRPRLPWWCTTQQLLSRGRSGAAAVAWAAVPGDQPVRGPGRPFAQVVDGVVVDGPRRSTAVRPDGC